MTEERGCSYLGCEDVAATYMVVPADPVSADMFLCPNHAPYVRRAIDDAQVGQVVVVDAEPGDRRRVTVWPRSVAR